jgi:hypothetical protein
MNPSNPKTPSEIEQLREIVTSAQALRFVMSKAELSAAKIIWKADPSKRKHVISAIMAASRDYVKAIENSAAAVTSPSHREPPNPTHDPMGPDCGKGFHEEFGICVPDNNS